MKCSVTAGKLCCPRKTMRLEGLRKHCIRWRIAALPSRYRNGIKPIGFFAQKLQATRDNKENDLNPHMPLQHNNMILIC